MTKLSKGGTIFGQQRKRLPNLYQDSNHTRPIPCKACTSYTTPPPPPPSIYVRDFADNSHQAMRNKKYFIISCTLYI